MFARARQEIRTMLRRTLVLLLVLPAIGLAACGEEEAAPVPMAMETAADPEPEPTPKAVAAKPRRGTRLRVIGSQFGRIAGDGPGLAFYVFDKERQGRSECYGDCAEAWPPVLAKGRPVAGRGIDPQLIGTTRRRGGERQVTYRGQPLYYYVHDRPGVVLCHDVDEFGGTWLVIRPDGRAV
jgi:predicted lipoprotein with Yx(FWY)xxD motif